MEGLNHYLVIFIKAKHEWMQEYMMTVVYLALRLGLYDKSLCISKYSEMHKLGRCLCQKVNPFLQYSLHFLSIVQNLEFEF